METETVDADTIQLSPCKSNSVYLQESECCTLQFAGPSISIAVEFCMPVDASAPMPPGIEEPLISKACRRSSCQTVSVTKWGLCRRISFPSVACPLSGRLPWQHSGVRPRPVFAAIHDGACWIKGGEIMAAIAWAPNNFLTATRLGNRGSPP